MDKDVKEFLSDDTRYAQTAEAVLRRDAINEIEEMTPYPVPRNGEKLTKRLDDYLQRTEKDPAIQHRKGAIGRDVMKTAWSEDLMTTDGYVDLGTRLKNFDLRFIVNNAICLPGINGSTLNMQEEDATIRISSFAAILQACGIKNIEFRSNGKKCSIADVVIADGLVTVYLELDETSADGRAAIGPHYAY